LDTTLSGKIAWPELSLLLGRQPVNDFVNRRVRKFDHGGRANELAESVEQRAVPDARPIHLVLEILG
jgi:hypothetical protein